MADWPTGGMANAVDSISGDDIGLYFSSRMITSGWMLLFYISMGLTVDALKPTTANFLTCFWIVPHIIILWAEQLVFVCLFFCLCAMTWVSYVDVKYG